MNRRKDVIRVIIALLLVALIIWVLYRKDYFAILEKVSISDVLVLTFFTLLSYFTAGFQMYYLVKKQNGISISFGDTLLLPLSMSLFSYIIPTNGGLLYSVFFLKKKYNVDYSRGFSIGIFSVYISFIITGIFGIVSCIYTKNYNFWILSISIIIIILPLIISGLNSLTQKIQFKKPLIIYRLSILFDKIVVNSNNLILNKEILFLNILINAVYLVLSVVSYQWLNLVLEIKLPLTSIFAIILITRVSSLIRLLPGNLGLEELYTGAIFKLIGRDPGIGVIFSLILRFTTVIIFVPLGILHTIFNLKVLKLSNLMDFHEKPILH